MSKLPDVEVVNPCDLADEEMKPLIRRLRRIEGQARGLQRMLLEQRDCEEVIIQLAAMRAALNKVGMSIVGNYMEGCLRDAIEDGKSGRESVDKAIEILMKLS